MRIHTVYLDSDSPAAVESVFNRKGTLFNEGVEKTTRKIIADIRMRGVSSLLEYSRKFDAPELETIAVSREEIESAESLPEHLAALNQAIERVRRFHKKQLDVITAGCAQHDDGSWSWGFKDESGAQMGQRMRPLRRVGIYVPGGKADYPSSVVMNCVPAQVAGVSELVLCSPAKPGGSLSPGVLAACRLLKIQEVYKLGGAQAIAAMAFGIGTPQVDKIVGPGNPYVNAAKRAVWGVVGLDAFAGPSEVCIIADDRANPAWAAADWLTQLEHSADCSGFIITMSIEMADRIKDEALKQAEDAPRKEILFAALRQNAAVFIASDMEEACDLANRIAPEHLTLMVEDAEKWEPRIAEAGCVYLGDYSPQSAGDYVIGPSHTLPTARAARFASPVSVLEFIKLNSVTSLTYEALKEMTNAIQAFGEMEGFPAHAGAASIRLKE